MVLNISRQKPQTRAFSYPLTANKISFQLLAALQDFNPAVKWTPPSMMFRDNFIMTYGNLQNFAEIFQIITLNFLDKNIKQSF